PGRSVVMVAAETRDADEPDYLDVDVVEDSGALPSAPEAADEPSWSPNPPSPPLDFDIRDDVDDAEEHSTTADGRSVEDERVRDDDPSGVRDDPDRRPDSISHRGLRSTRSTAPAVGRPAIATPPRHRSKGIYGERLWLQHRDRMSADFAVVQRIWIFGAMIAAALLGWG
ncbi:hypothetical protein H7H73_10650, partial [Mycobacterium rufum]|nr:hypothetical protein [Mycolicibacterium rufum]